MSTFRALENNFKGDIVTPEHPEYETAIQRWAKNAVRRAKVVAFVKDANDASLAIKYARESGLFLAIRGGGHSPAGSSSEGIVIGLSSRWYSKSYRSRRAHTWRWVWMVSRRPRTCGGQPSTGDNGSRRRVDPSLVDRVFQITAEWREKNSDPSCCLVEGLTRRPPPERESRVIIVPFYNGPVEEGRKIFKEFLDLCPSDATGEVPYEQMNSLQNSNFPHGRNYYFQGVVQDHYSAAAAKKSAFERVCEVSSKDVSVVLGIELYPLRKVNSIPKDATAFNLRGAESNIFSLAAWDDDSHEAALRGKEAAHAVTQSISISEEKPEVSNLTAYGNYLGDEKLSSERSLKVFGENYPRLQQLKKKYDPDMLFSKWFKIVPA
ncbi:hypothetical protein ACEPAI_5978 [Sanghuangporus weigelae]